MLGLLDRIKAFFKRNKPSPKPSSSTAPVVSPPLNEPPSQQSEGDLLVQEHEQLEVERSRLRYEITMVDAKYSSGEMEAGERDQAYRMRLARAGRISMRQLEIRSKLVKLGHPIPDEWGAINIVR